MVAGVVFIQLQMKEVGYACLLCHSLPHSLETEPGARVVANPPVSDSQDTEVTGMLMAMPSFFFVGAGDLNSGPHACTLSTVTG